MRNFVKKMWSDVVLGVLFVVSGFVKAVDPVGFSYKIEEYLGMFQLSSWRECDAVVHLRNGKYGLIEVKLGGECQRFLFRSGCEDAFRVSHSWAVLALEYGMPIESVSKILGHTNITTTQIYAKVTLDSEYEIHILTK